MRALAAVQRVARGRCDAVSQHLVHAVEEFRSVYRCSFAVSASAEEENGTDGNEYDAAYDREYHAAVIGV